MPEMPFCHCCCSWSATSLHGRIHETWNSIPQLYLLLRSSCTVQSCTTRHIDTWRRMSFPLLPCRPSNATPSPSAMAEPSVGIISGDGNGLNYNTYSSDQSPFFGETVTVDYTSSPVHLYQRTSGYVNTMMVIESVSLIESVLPKFVAIIQGKRDIRIRSSFTWLSQLSISVLVIERKDSPMTWNLCSWQLQLISGVCSISD